MVDTMSTQDEIDLSKDSAVEAVTATFSITETEQVASESEKGTGTYERITVESEDYPLPINLRFFTEYESKVGKDTNWVARQRGQLKLLAKAVFGEPIWNRDNAVGKSFVATTKDDGSGYPTLGRFKAAE